MAGLYSLRRKWRPLLVIAALMLTAFAALGLTRGHIVSEIVSRSNQFPIGSVTILLVAIYFCFGSVELLAEVMVPAALGLLWTVGVCGWLALPVASLNGASGLLIVALGVNCSIFLVIRKLYEWQGRPLHKAMTSAPVAVSAFVSVVLLALAMLTHKREQYSIATIFLGIASTTVAANIFTPMCMDLLLFKPQPRGAPRWWHPLGTLWVLIHLGGSQVFLYYLLRPILKIVCPRQADDRLRQATRWMARGVVKALPFGKLEFQNITPETFSRPCVVISNHQSAVDVMLVVSLPGDVRQTAKKRVFDAPMLGIGCKLLGHVMVEPNDPETTLRRCRDRLAEGACVHFYPEGTRSHDGFLQRFHRGAFELAVKLKRDILPIILCDTNTAMPRDSYWFEPYHVTVRALPRVTPENFDYSQGSTALMRHCREIVRDALQHQLDTINTPRVVRRKVNRLYRYQGKFVEQFVYWKMKIDPIFESLDSVVPRTGHVLDLGCGYGMASHWLSCYTDRRTFTGVDYDPDKIRVARQTAAENPRIHFELQDLLEWQFPGCDAVLLLDVLHYWPADEQQLILNKVARALRPGGKLILRDAARDSSKAHERVHRWEKFATRFGLNRTREGLHFQTLAELETALERAGFPHVELRRNAGRDSNVLLVAEMPTLPPRPERTSLNVSVHSI